MDETTGEEKDASPVNRSEAGASERSLIEAAQNGDQRAFGLLVSDEGLDDSALALLWTALNKYDSTVTPPAELAQVYLNLADMHEGMGELDSGAVAYEAALAAAPKFGKTYMRAAAFFARYGGHHITDSLYFEGQRHQKMSAVDYFNWGLSYVTRRMYTKGVSKMRFAVVADPNMHQAWYTMGYAYFQEGKPKDSVLQFLDRALAIDSTFQPALTLKQVVEERDN